MQKTEMNSLQEQFLTGAEQDGRGVTVLNTRGGYTNEGRVMIISVLSSRQLVELKDKIRTIDENSFLIVGQVTEVFGEGFTKFSP